MRDTFSHLNNLYFCEPVDKAALHDTVSAGTVCVLLILGSSVLGSVIDHDTWLVHNKMSLIDGIQTWGTC